jgi:protein-disulfide isomerase
VHPLDRRRALTLTAVAALLPIAGTAWAQRKPAGPEQVDVTALMAPGPLPDLILGKADAPVTIVEYASKTCGHCANFHNKVYPELKSRYIDTGKVRFVYREYPIDDVAMAASMLARCAGATNQEAAFAMTSVLFQRQENWAFVRGNPVPELFKVARQAGFTQESFEKCLTDQKLMEGIAAIRERGSKDFGVNATPTFFINGKRFADRSDQIEAFAKAIDPLLPKS